MSDIWTAVGTVAATLFGVWRMLAHYETRNDAAHAELGRRIDGVRTDLSDRIDAQGDRIDAQGGRIDTLSGRIDALSGRIDALEGRFEGRFTMLESRLDTLGGRIDRLYELMSGQRS